MSFARWFMRFVRALRPTSPCSVLYPNRGFTLLELLLVLSIVAIILPMGIGGFSSTLTDLRSATAMRHMASMFSYGRHHALTSNQNTTLCALDESGKCIRNWQSNSAISLFIDSNRNRRFEKGERLLRQIRWPLQDGELSWRASLARPFIEFYGVGKTWQNGTLFYCPANRDARHARALVLSHSGRSYLPGDSNGDGIREDRQGKNLRC